MTKSSDVIFTCPSCGVEYQKHLGLVGTCAEVQRLAARVKELEAFAQVGSKESPDRFNGPRKRPTGFL